MANPREDDDLLSLVAKASVDDLSVLVDYITNAGKGRISLDNEVMSTLVAAKARGVFSDTERKLIAHEVQLFGGNTLVNLMRRGKGVLYREILGDVADHLKIAHHKHDSAAVVENGILASMAARAWEKLSTFEKSELVSALGVKSVGAEAVALATILAAIRSAGLATYRFSAIAAQAIANQTLGRTITLGATAGAARGAASMLGPVGLAITGLWTIADMASPAYRVTVPCVIQLAYMRHKQQSRTCTRCQTPNKPDAKFCSECGERILSEEEA